MLVALQKKLIRSVTVTFMIFLAVPSIAQTKSTAGSPREKEAIVTGGKSGTYFPMGSDLARLIADPVGLTLDVIESKGSVQNVIEVSQTRGVGLGIVQADVYQHYVDLALAGDKAVRSLLESLRVVLPMHSDELHFIVAADSPLQYVHQIRDAKIYMDVVGSGTRVTGLSVYRALFGKEAKSGEQIVEPFIRDDAVGDTPPVLYRNSAFMSLVDKTSDPGRRVDVILVNAGQPAASLKNLTSEAVKLLEVSPSNPQTIAALESFYRIGRIDKSSYTWNARDVPALTVQNYLITAKFSSPTRNQYLSDFSQSLCKRYSVLIDQGHPKWKHLSWAPGDGPMPPLARGWRYAESTHATLQNCRQGGTTQNPPIQPVKDLKCSEAQRSMMLCK